MRCLVSLTLALFALTTLSPLCFAEEQKMKDEERKEEKKKEKKKEEKKDNKGALDTFEGEATKKEEETKTKKHEDEDDSDDDASLILTILEVPAILALGGGIQSWERIQPPATSDRFTPPLRSRGEPLIPFFRFDLTYQEVESDVQAVDGRVEAGYGPLGVQVRRTHYTEDVPPDDLDFTQIHGLYRMSIDRYGEIDLGFGAGILAGNEEHSGFSFALPMTFQPISWLGLAFRPSWTSIEGKSVADYDGGISVGFPYVTAETGYRWLSSDGSTLKGPFLGGSIHF